MLIAALLSNADGLHAQPPAGYYDTVDATNSTTLRATLHDVIDDHTRFPYTDSSTDTWDIINLADEDPNNTGNIIDLYKNASYGKIPGGVGAYNREHSWPKSYGFPNDAIDNYPYTDTHHLFACDAGYNSSRSNKPFRLCDAACSENPTDFNDGRGGGTGVYPGNSNWTSGSFTQGTWETWDGRKGDVARAILYMDIRYEGGIHGITGVVEPDLIATDNEALIDASNTGSNESVAYMGMLSVLLQWHAQDPVDSRELWRNEVVYSFQGNRNPFIDHPEWAECLHNNLCGGSGDTTPPADPTGLVAVAGTGQVDLSWNANSENDLAGYYVYRATASGGPYARITGSVETNNFYTDSSVVGGTTYFYVVRAIDTSANESGNSGEASATPTGGGGGGPGGVLLSEVLYDVSSGDDGFEWVELYNSGTSAVDLSGYCLGNGGTSYTYSTVQLSGTIASGATFVVGGPTSSSINANPSFDLVANFSPDFQNSGSTGDGVALFNVACAQVSGSTVPVDAVIYGPNNNSGLIDETGSANAPEVGDASAGSSLERLDLAGAWTIQGSPNPNATTLPPPSGCSVDADCDDGAFCNGAETCNAGTCKAGTPPACDDGLWCNGAETCNETTDSCDAGAPPVCDDGAFCNGTETCNETTDSCDSGADPCDPGTETCNEGADICEPIGGGSGVVLLSEVLYDVSSGDDGFEWVELYNSGTSAVDLSGYCLGNGGTSYTTSTAQLSGTIASGATFVVGGPTSSSINANPSFDLAVNFNPDFQNSGSAGDGVALFDVACAGVNGSTVPVDAVIYGPNNSNGLIDETGSANAPEVGDASPGSSIERVDLAGSWQIQGSPTPNSTPLASTGCVVDADCDDGLYCNGAETCNAGTCEAGITPSCDDGLWCNGVETCNESTDSCDSGTAPTCDDGLFCNGTEICNESTDSCDSGMAPTCDDGLFCNGTETCNETTDSCDSGTAPSCDDGLYCNGVETCNESTDSCNAGTPVVCDDGLFCNGTESCNESTDSCDAGTDPCSGGETCNETADVCEGGGGPVIWMSFRSNTSVPGVGTVTDEDIVSYDEGTGTWALEFDGSDVGLGGLEISALGILPSGDLLLSFTAAGTVGGLSVDDSDIVQFTPTSLGATTAGSFSLYFDGSDVGLTSNGEDVDGLTLDSSGNLVISTTGGFSGSGASGADEDLFTFTGTLGSATSGSFTQLFDGSDVGLGGNSAEDVDAASLTASGNLLFSTVGTFSVTGLGGEDEDVVEFSGTFGSSTSGTFSMRQDLSALGIAAGEDIGSLHIIE